MDIIFSASIIASFIAGMVALFAPCCITVLLPAYLASAFREKKNVLKMTFIFFLGLAAVLVPIGLGAAALAQAFRDFHKELYLFGGLFMLVLAVMALMGKGIGMPMPKKLKAGMKMDASNSKSVFVLGVLSGAATSCCAPVLAGAMTLAVISGAFWKAIIVTFSYVFGMAFPLFIAAYFYDKYKVEKSKIIHGKLLELKIRTRKFYVHSTNLVSSVIFLIMGVVMVWLALSGNEFWSPHAQASLGQSLNSWSQQILEALMLVPDFVWGILIVSAFVWLLYKLKINIRK